MNYFYLLIRHNQQLMKHLCFMPVYVCSCPFLSVSVSFVLFLSVSVHFCLFQSVLSILVFFCFSLEMAGNVCNSWKWIEMPWCHTKGSGMTRSPGVVSLKIKGLSEISVVTERKRPIYHSLKYAPDWKTQRHSLQWNVKNYAYNRIKLIHRHKPHGLVGILFLFI